MNIRTSSLLHCNDYARPCIYDSFSQRCYVVKNIVCVVRAWSHIGSLLQDCCYHREVGFKMGADCLRDVPKALQYSRLELIA